jgi:DNA-binding CsgD family transcriptional regulator
MPKQLMLTKREAELLDALCELGETDLVARRLGVSEKTVSTYIYRIMTHNKYPNRLMLALARDRENRNVQKHKAS